MEIFTEATRTENEEQQVPLTTTENEEQQVPMTRSSGLGILKELMAPIFTPERIEGMRTASGDTQLSERIVISLIRDCLNANQIAFEEASSQQSRDFRNLFGIDGFDWEIKKTNSDTIYFNDCMPNENIEYLILYSGKTYNRDASMIIPAQLIFVNGSEFIADSPWLTEFERELNALRDKYARGAAARELSGIMSVYPRPTYKANISKFIVK